ncbi:MAG: hypothetical protein NVSMB18_24210 [Acetobacteraceae bacterium]
MGVGSTAPDRDDKDRDDNVRENNDRDDNDRDDAGHDQAVLFAWVEQVCGGPIRASTQTSGGNRARSWSMDVHTPQGIREVFLRYAPPRPPGAEPYTTHREAQVYRAIAPIDIRAPKLIAEHPAIQAILTDRAHGIAEFRRLTDAPTKQAIAAEFMQDLARLHAHPAAGVSLDGGGAGARIIDHVRAELAIWRAMYAETGQADALLDLAFRWLEDNMPDPDGPVVLVHGDAGPGNFLFADGHLTAIIDWELAHLGDPMEDLAWFSMRCVMEPVPDFAASLRDYERQMGQAIHRARILYHRVLVSTRVVVIRHRNVTGEFAHAIVSRALNRRLLIEALAEASGTTVHWPAPIDAAATPRTPLFANILADLRDVIVARSTDGQVIAKAKNAAKVVKYLDAWDRLGPAIEAADQADPATADFAGTLGRLARQAAREAQLASGASGGIASRHYPALPEPLP